MGTLSYAIAIGIALLVLPLAVLSVAAVELSALLRSCRGAVASLLPAGGWSAALGSCRALALNPTADLDLTANTDGEDLVVFFGDVLEFAEQDKALLVDAISESWFLVGWHQATFALEAYCLIRIRKQTLSAHLARFFNA